MNPVTTEQLELLAPYIAGAQPDDRGEIEIYCPVHGDTRRSASLNVNKGVWCCHAGSCGGGSVRHLCDASDSWVPAEGRVTTARPSNGASKGRLLPTTGDIAHWKKRINREPQVRDRLCDTRGLTIETLSKADIGWDGRYYKIPVYGPGRMLWNVRTYDMRPSGGRSKIWNTRGMGDARLYPFGVLERSRLNDRVLFPEGEWDALISLQHEQAAVTRTDGAGKPWHDEWTEHFVGLRVYLCGDADDAGDSHNEETCAALEEVAEVYQCHLPYRHKESQGHDLSDYLMEFSYPDRRLMLMDLIETATRKV